MNIAQNLIDLRQKIQRLEAKYHRALQSVFLLVVSKGQPIACIKEAYIAGQKAFGENYLQEALKKMQSLTDLSIEWHFIGSIQSNKTRKIAAHFNWVHTVCTFEIAKRLDEQRPNDLPPLNLLIQVNITGAKSKSGVKIAEASDLAAYCHSLKKIKLRGLMTISDPTQNFEETSHTFQTLANLLQVLNQKNYNLDVLSMGMTDDLEAAIAKGSTLVRVGRGVFGERFS